MDIYEPETCQSSTSTSLDSPVKLDRILEFFPISDLHSLDKIVTKLDSKSYFRIQQTCRQMNELIRVNRNIKLCLRGKHGVMPDIAELIWEQDGKRPFELRAGFVDKDYFINPESLYGVRFQVLYPPPVEDEFELFCETIRNYRITAGAVVMGSYRRTIDFSRGQCLTLFRALKPTIIKINSKGSDRYKALFEVKYLKEVEITMDHDVAMREIEAFLTHFEVINLYGKGDRGCSVEEVLNVFSSLLPLLRTHPLTKLRSFHFTAALSEVMPTLEEQQTWFDESGVTIEEREDGRKGTVYTYKNIRLLNNTPGLSCVFYLEEAYVKIHYGSMIGF